MDVRIIMLCLLTTPGLCLANQGMERDFDLADVRFIRTVKDGSGEWLLYLRLPPYGALAEAREGDWIGVGNGQIEEITENEIIIKLPPKYPLGNESDRILAHDDKASAMGGAEYGGRAFFGREGRASLGRGIIVAQLNASTELKPNFETIESEQKDKLNSASREFPIASLNIDNTQGLAVEFGMLFPLSNNEGVAVSIEPGVAGTKFHIGYGGFWVSGGLASYRAVLTQLSVSKDYGGLHKNEKYNGIELFIGLNGIVVQAGYLTSNDGKVAHTFGIGIGF